MKTTDFIEIRNKSPNSKVEKIIEEKFIKTQLAGLQSEIIDTVSDYCLAFTAASGLTWDPALNFIYPFINKGQFSVELTYKGELFVCQRVGLFKLVQAWALHNSDDIEVLNNASEDAFPDIEISSSSATRGLVNCGIASVLLNDGSFGHAYISAEELKEIATNGSETWQGIYADEMIKKQAIKRLLTHYPKPVLDVWKYVEELASCYLPDHDFSKLTQPIKTNSRMKFIPAGLTSDNDSALNKLLA